MNQLYPLKFQPIYKTRIWGGSRLKSQYNKTKAPSNCGESWEISTVPDDISVVSNGFLKGNNLLELVEIYMGDLVGDSVYEKFGDEFPLLIKFIDANDKLSVQVHPDDDIAYDKHHAYGKTEMWYVLDAIPNAFNITGLKPDLKPNDLAQHLKNQTVENVLITESVEKGDVFFIQAGRVHAIGEGISLIEIQQTSDITYRLYDYNRADAEGNHRELHVDLALDAIDFTITENAKIRIKPELNQTNQLISCPYFTSKLITFDEKQVRNYIDLDSFVIYICAEGSCEIQCEGDPETYTLKVGETILVPAFINEITLTPKQYSKLIEIYIDEE